MILREDINIIAYGTPAATTTTTTINTNFTKVLFFSGKVLWQVDKTVVQQRWNFYNALILPDLTEDGVPEVVLSHGGDPKYRAKVIE